MHPLDYAFVVLICLSSVGIGVFTSCTGGKQKSTQEYIMGNRQMHLLPVAVSILVSFWSAVALLGTPAEIFYYGSFYNVGCIATAMACLISAYTFVPLFYPLKITSIYEYLELRYHNKFIRYWSCILYVITSILYLAVAQLAPAIALNATMGIPDWAGILIIGCISIVYTALGGIRAVIWSDVFQSIFILVGLIVIIVKATIDSGGLGTVMSINAEWNRLDTFNWSLDPRVRMTVWSSTFGAAVGWLPWYGPNQAAFQRFASLPTLAKARWSILLNISGIVILFVLLAFTGYALFAVFAIEGCDPYSAGLVPSINQLLPFYAKHRLRIPSFAGIIVACILSGAFSTTSTVLNSQAAVTVFDFIQPYKNLPDEKATVVTKWLVVAYGILGSGLALISTYISGISLVQISGSFLNASTGATLGVYLLASCVPKSTWQGAFAGSLASLSLVGWICVGSLTQSESAPMLPLPTQNCSFNGNSSLTTQAPSGPTELPTGLAGLYRVSYQWYGPIGAFSCLLVGGLVSLPSLLSSQVPDTPEEFILPGARQVLRWLKSPAYNQVSVDGSRADDDTTKKETIM